MIYETYPSMELKTSEDIGIGKIPCPYCGESGRASGLIWIKARPGATKFGKSVDTERVTCPCDTPRVFWNKIYDTVPARYRGLRLSDMKPSALAKNATPEFQQTVIDHLKSNLWQSQFFLGPVGVGKTALQYALWHSWVALVVKCYPNDSCSMRWPIWNVDANELMDQHHAWTTQREHDAEVAYPEVTAELIKVIANRYPLDKEFKPVLVLREIDKLNPTQFKIDTLFKIIGYLHDHLGVLILDSNLTWAEFGGRFGLPLSRRVRVLCHMVNYHDQTIELPSEDA